MTPREKAVNTALWGVLTVGGIVTAALAAGPMQEHHLELTNQSQTATQAAAEEHAYALDRALVVGGMVLALPGVGMALARPIPEEHSNR